MIGRGLNTRCTRIFALGVALAILEEIWLVIAIIAIVVCLASCTAGGP